MGGVQLSRTHAAPNRKTGFAPDGKKQDLKGTGCYNGFTERRDNMPAV